MLTLEVFAPSVLVATTLVVPAAIAVTLPVWSTVKILSSSLFSVKVLSSAFSGKTLVLTFVS